MKHPNEKNGSEYLLLLVVFDAVLVRLAFGFEHKFAVKVFFSKAIHFGKKYLHARFFSPRKTKCVHDEEAIPMVQISIAESSIK